MKKYILMFVSSMMLVSCLDTIILPDDKTVDEDFWQTADDVASMVNAAYSDMTSEAVLERLIVWSGFRSDELERAASPTGDIPDALEEIEAVNMQTTNRFAQWAPLYSVINRCNIVLARAGEVRNIDPNYTEGTYQADRSQMLALRALCYFYLVRNYRDVPYITEAYMNSSQLMQVPQTAPATIIDKCIEDLEGAVSNSLAARSYPNNWRRVGWFTTDGINTLLADLYLWRASVNHSGADYQKCISYCDDVILSKRNQHVAGFGEVAEKEYPLADAADLYSDLFISQNAEESIFELQSRANTAFCKYFYKYANNNSNEGFLKATGKFNTTAGNYATALSQGTLWATSDLRYYAATNSSSSAENASFDVRKMISHNPVVSKDRQAREPNAFNFGGLDQNYPVYRLTDVLLMKAEAMVQLVSDTASVLERQAQLREPFHLIQVVNSRALHRDNQADSLRWASVQGFSKNDMENLVMQEQQREFCFEGKRWYDLLRLHYRHSNEQNYNRTYAELVDEGGEESLLPIYKDLLTLITSGRLDAAAVSAKMRHEAYLYLPIPNSDIIVCPLLRQNPAYKDVSEYQKKY